ncbi:hypothetical protein FHX81_6712 [Saccharothrix saharensis]|uniref:Methyltransferase family protein n=1 Tax=Saccharothrix saharensis TaxID=571190 RepID=A0A543JN60_9PSEU|nr:hypothetical protein [Saccharothrix saharensis]TQM84269.1 hypothetical protein FHX81_6712 [Saccharothrix saharensis]
MTAAPDVVPLPEDPLTEVVAAVLGDGSHVVIDLLDVGRHQDGPPVDAVRAGDDLLPRLAHENALDQALLLARTVLRPGGLFVAAVPELDKLGRLRPTAPPPKVSGRGPERQVTVQLWDWAADGESYALEVVRLVRGAETWEVANTVSTRHRVLSPDQVAAALADAGFGAVQRLSPAECGHPLPVWVAVA